MNEQAVPSHSWRDLRYQSFYKIVDQIILELQNMPPQNNSVLRRKLRGKNLINLSYCVEKLMRDSLSVVLQRARIAPTPIAKSKQHYLADREDKRLSYKLFIKRAYEGMIELGYLYEVTKGYFDRSSSKGEPSQSRLSRYIATEKLIALFANDEQKAFAAILPPSAVPELILVKKKVETVNGTRRVRLPLTETSEVARMRANLEKINTVLRQNWYDINITDDEFVKLQEEMISEDNLAKGWLYNLDLGQMLLYRVFNDEELTTGGRFYGGWWQSIKKEYRSKLIVNGKRMIEYDYSNLHPTLLYQLEGLTPPQDSYTKIIEENFATTGIPLAELRSVIKIAFNAMINAKTSLKGPPRGMALKKHGISWKELSAAILRSHAPISGSFYSGRGLQLQRIDSDIAEKVMLKFADWGYPILPIHDSFLAHNGFENTLDKVMKDAYKSIMNHEIDIKALAVRKIYIPKETGPDEFGEKQSLLLDDILESLQELGHERRLDQFFERRKLGVFT